MTKRGLDTSNDHVYPDLVFGIPTPPYFVGNARTVGIGVMDFHGTNDDDRSQADEIHAAYVAKMKTFVRWLVDNDHKDPPARR